MDLIESSLLKAGGVMFLVLLIGILSGLAMDQARTGYLDEQIRQTELQTETFVVSQEYLRNSSRNYCRVMQDRIPEMAARNAQIGQDLQQFTGKSISSEQEYDYLKRKYYVNQLRLYLMLDDHKERCDQETDLILFFFDQDMNSQRQGAVLTEYRRNVDNDTYVFSYNLDSKESQVLDLLKTDYGIEDGPVIVVNGDRVYRDYVPLKQLKEVLGSKNISARNGSSS